MGVTTPKSPDLRETDTANARYTDLNRANKNLGLSLIGNPDAISGILALPPNELKIPIGYIEDGVGAKVGSRVLLGNRIAEVVSFDNDDGGTEAMLHLEVLEVDLPLPIGAVEAEENFIDPTRRQVDHVIGIQTDENVDEALRRGGTTYGLVAAAPIFSQPNGANPNTWGATAQAQRAYLGFGLVSVTLDIYSDAGVTGYGGNLNFYPVDEDQVIASQITATVIGGAATVQLQRGVAYKVRGGNGALAEVQPHPDSDSTFIVPLVGDPATLVAWNVVP